MSSALDFDRALVRTPSRSVVDGLRAHDHGAPSYDGVLAEHDAYVRALERRGVHIETLPPLEAHPDSIFVEDAALVFTGAAIVLRPGAPSRRGEAAEIAPALLRHFDRVLRLDRGAVDGGDILTTPNAVFIGQSARTDAAGARALIALLDEIGLRGRAVATPANVLHLKSDCALLDEETILVTERLAQSDPFPGFRILRVPHGEEAAANALRVNGRVFLSEGHPRTAALLSGAGYTIVTLATREIARIDAGLSCLSLRWRAAR